MNEWSNERQCISTHLIPGKSPISQSCWESRNEICRSVNVTSSVWRPAEELIMSHSCQVCDVSPAPPPPCVSVGGGWSAHLFLSLVNICITQSVVHWLKTFCRWKESNVWHETGHQYNAQTGKIMTAPCSSSHLHPRPETDLNWF